MGICWVLYICVRCHALPGPCTWTNIRKSQLERKGSFEGLLRSYVRVIERARGRKLTCILRPESQGLVCASIYILLLILFIPFSFSTSIASLSGRGSKIEGLLGTASLHHEVSTPQR
jgi:hypothetical protein